MSRTEQEGDRLVVGGKMVASSVVTVELDQAVRRAERWCDALAARLDREETG